MKFFMLSKCGEGCGLLYRLLLEGNDVCIKIHEKDYTNVYEGIIDRREAPEEGSIVIVDSSGLGKEADELKKKGFLVFGGSSFADKLEHDREFGFAFMRKHEINVPRVEAFKDFSKGIEYVKERDTKLVFKPSGSLPCKLTYCASDSEDLINYMKFVEKVYGKDIDDFILQDFIEGETLSTEFWVGKNGFIEPSNHTVEVKKFLNDNLGPSTGCQGNLVWTSDEDDFVIDALRKIEEDLVKENFLGCIDLNCIINDEDLFGLEWTPRFGLDAMPTFLKMAEKMEIGKLISDACNGTVHEMKGLSEFAGGVRLSIPPYPAEPRNSKELEHVLPSSGIPLECLAEYDEYLYAYEIRCDDGEIVHSDGTGVIAVFSDNGESPEECLECPYDILEEIKIPDKQYRTDLGEVLPDMYRKACELL